jgi:hypothetical protein
MTVWIGRYQTAQLAEARKGRQTFNQPSHDLGGDGCGGMGAREILIGDDVFGDVVI